MSIPSSSTPAPAETKSTWGSFLCKGAKATAWTAAIGTTVAVSAVVAFQTRAIINTWAPKIILDYAIENSEKIGKDMLSKAIAHLPAYVPVPASLPDYIPTKAYAALGAGVIAPAFYEMTRPYVEMASYGAGLITGGITYKAMNATFNGIANCIGKSSEEPKTEDEFMVISNPLYKNTDKKLELSDTEEEIVASAEMTADTNIPATDENELLPSVEQAEGERLADREPKKIEKTILDVVPVEEPTLYDTLNIVL